MCCEVPSLTAMTCPFSFFLDRESIRSIHRIRGSIIVVDFQYYIRQQTITVDYKCLINGLVLTNDGTLLRKYKTHTHNMKELSNQTTPSGEIVIYQPDENMSLDVRLEEDTVWLSQQQMTMLFQTTKQNVSLHINNIFKEGELLKEATVKDYLTVQSEGGRKVNRIVSFYNLDVIISVGYRVKSLRGTQFRQWANSHQPCSGAI